MSPHPLSCTLSVPSSLPCISTFVSVCLGTGPPRGGSQTTNLSCALNGLVCRDLVTNPAPWTPGLGADEFHSHKSGLRCFCMPLSSLVQIYIAVCSSLHEKAHTIQNSSSTTSETKHGTELERHACLIEALRNVCPCIYEFMCTWK